MDADKMLNWVVGFRIIESGTIYINNI